MVLNFYIFSQVKKPAVEKRRRDRINSSIEQMRVLLSSEIKTHHIRSKLEKADILEMTVHYLKKRTHQTALESPGPSYAEGFNRCLQETLCFFTAHTELKDSQKMLMTHYTTTPLGGRSGRSHDDHISTSGVLLSSKTSTIITPPMWRPW